MFFIGIFKMLNVIQGMYTIFDKFGLSFFGKIYFDLLEASFQLIRKSFFHKNSIAKNS